jgi:hypothetical protein
MAIDEAALARFEVNCTSHRRLDMELRLVDLSLMNWAPWARPGVGELGYPRRWVTARAEEGGILAKDIGRAHPPEWPAAVVAIDGQVARLPTRHQAAVFAHYFHMALPAEQRAVVYSRLAPYLAKIRPSRLLGGKPATLGRRAFQDDLDRARWVLKVLMDL